MVFSIFNNQYFKRLLKRHWKILIFLVFLNFALKFPINLEFFDGLEYEDAYIYKASARSIYENKYHISNINPFFPTSCVFGSINECKHSAIFVTNFLGYPYLISLGYSTLGYHPCIANIISLVFSSLSIIFLFICALLIIENSLFALSCSFVFITIPMFNIYSSTSLTEPLSNSYVILVLMLYIMFVFYPVKKNDHKIISTLLGMLALMFTMIYAILVKTTNLSLAFCLPLVASFYFVFNKESRDNEKATKNLFMTFPVIAFVLLFSFIFLNVLKIADINRGDIGQDPFSFAYLKNLVPVFLRSLINFKWHLFYFIFFLSGLFISIKIKYGLFLPLTFLSYFVLYTTHYRSYYFTRGVPVSIDETFRYMTSMISIYSLVVGIGIYYFLKYLRKIFTKFKIYYSFKILVLSAIMVLLFISFQYTSKNRAYFIEDEIRSRIYPVMKTLEFLEDENTTVITSEHILFQIYGDKNLDLIDFCSIDVLIPTDLIDEKIKTQDVIYLQTIENDSISYERYFKQFSYVESKNKELLHEDTQFKIYKLI